MSVVSNARVIFCEGQANSPDIVLWRRLLLIRPDEMQEQSEEQETKYHPRILLTPMGGKQAAQNFARGYETASTNTNWLIIRDRDLDAEYDGKAPVIRRNSGKTILTGYTCIESYFLFSDLMERYIDSTKINSAKLPKNHRNTLRETIEQLSDYQAVRWGLQKVREKVQEVSRIKSLYRAAGQFDLPNRLTDEDGKLPPNLDFDACQSNAITMCEQFRETFHSVDIDFLRQSIQHFQSIFVDEAFLENDFRFWFHGKDVLKAWLRRYPNIGYDDYCIWAAKNISIERDRFPDLIKIQEICHDN